MRDGGTTIGHSCILLFLCANSLLHPDLTAYFADILPTTHYELVYEVEQGLRGPSE